MSILVPVFRREALIASCIESALAQTWPNVEVVVVDNASEDRTFEICSRLAGLDSRVRLFRNGTNVGPVRNWMRCVAEARGSFAKLLFSDDLLAPRCVEQLMELMTSDSVAFSLSAVSVGPRPWAGPPWYRWRPTRGHVPSREFVADALNGPRGLVPVSPGAALFRLEDLRADLSADVPSAIFTDFADHGAGPDLLLSLRAAARRPLVGFTPEVLSYFRMHPASITMANLGMVKERYRAARLYFASVYEGRALLPSTIVVEWLGAGCPGGPTGIGRFAQRYLPGVTAPRIGGALREVVGFAARRLRPRILFQGLRVAAWMARLRLERLRRTR